MAARRAQDRARRQRGGQRGGGGRDKGGAERGAPRAGVPQQQQSGGQSPHDKRRGSSGGGGGGGGGGGSDNWRQQDHPVHWSRRVYTPVPSDPDSIDEVREWCEANEIHLNGLKAVMNIPRQARVKVLAMCQFDGKSRNTTAILISRIKSVMEAMMRDQATDGEGDATPSDREHGRFTGWGAWARRGAPPGQHPLPRPGDGASAQHSERGSAGGEGRRRECDAAGAGGRQREVHPAPWRSRAREGDEDTDDTAGMPDLCENPLDEHGSPPRRAHEQGGARDDAPAPLFPADGGLLGLAANRGISQEAEELAAQLVYGPLLQSCTPPRRPAADPGRPALQDAVQLQGVMHAAGGRPSPGSAGRLAPGLSPQAVGLGLYPPPPGLLLGSPPLPDRGCGGPPAAPDLLGGGVGLIPQQLAALQHAALAAPMRTAPACPLAPIPESTLNREAPAAPPPECSPAAFAAMLQLQFAGHGGMFN